MNLYEVLGVENDADNDQIKLAYRKLAAIHHPDVGGDEDRFKEIQEAYSTLCDSEKKAYYDTYGEPPIDVTDATFAVIVSDATNKAMRSLLSGPTFSEGKPMTLNQLIIKEMVKWKRSFSASISEMTEYRSRIQDEQLRIDGADMTSTLEVVAVTLIKIEQNVIEEIEEKEYKLKCINDVLSDLSSGGTSEKKEEVLYVGE